MTQSSGRIVTFYSYKGGTGRSMALANVAWILASQGERVLAIDWDLEAPGLHRYFHPFMEDKELTSSRGIIDFLLDFSEGARMLDSSATPPEHPWFEEFVNLEPYTFSLDWDFPGKGTLDLVPAGQQSAAYAIRVMGFDWSGFYTQLGGGVFLEAVKQRLRGQYDWILIDSRTGISDTSGLCTVQLPDDVVVCFTLNGQSISGAAAVAQSAFSQRLKPNGEPGLRIWPVPTRVELAEKERLEAARDVARDAFERYLLRLPRTERRNYWGRVEIPYSPYFAFEEVLATFADRRRHNLSVLAAIESLTALLTDGAVIGLQELPESQRRETLAKFSRTMQPQHERAGAAPHFFLSYASEDRSLAVRVRSQLNERLNGCAQVVTEDMVLRPGDSWRTVLNESLLTSVAMVALITPNRLSRAHLGRSDEELDLARERGVRVIPILVDTNFEALSKHEKLAHLRDRVGYEVASTMLSGNALERVSHDLSLLANDLSLPSAPHVLDPEDPQRGLWGGAARRNGRTLLGRVRPVDHSEGWFEIELCVEASPNSPLTSAVDFHLHPTMVPPVIRVEPVGGRAVCRLTAWGAFTVGAHTDGGLTRLELDLATLDGAPKLFRER